MSQTEQVAILSIMVMCGGVAAAHILSALYLLHRAEKKVQSPQKPKQQTLGKPPKASIDPVNPRAAKERKKRQRLYL